jgi:hypothetical protein
MLYHIREARSAPSGCNAIVSRRGEGVTISRIPSTGGTSHGMIEPMMRAIDEAYQHCSMSFDWSEYLALGGE